MPEDDAWTEAKSLAATTEDHELLDPTLSSERLLYRLFHERGVRVFEPTPLADVCRCSAERIDAMLQSFSPAERQAMVGDDGMIGVTCEFCSVKRIFDPRDYDMSADVRSDGSTRSPRRVEAALDALLGATRRAGRDRAAEPRAGGDALRRARRRQAAAAVPDDRDRAGARRDGRAAAARGLRRSNACIAIRWSTTTCRRWTTTTSAAAARRRTRRSTRRRRSWPATGC